MLRAEISRLRLERTNRAAPSSAWRLNPPRREPRYAIKIDIRKKPMRLSSRPAPTLRRRGKPTPMARDSASQSLGSNTQGLAHLEKHRVKPGYQSQRTAPVPHPNSTIGFRFDGAE